MRTSQLLRSFSSTATYFPRMETGVRFATGGRYLAHRPAPPQEEQTFDFKSMDDIYAAIAQGNAKAIRYWLDNRAVNFRALYEAGLDLALQKQQWEIAAMLREQLRLDAEVARGKVEKGCQHAGIYDRVTVHSTSANFKTVLLEVNASGLELIICYRTPLIAPLFDPLKKWGGRDYPGGLVFLFARDAASQDRTRFRMHQILNYLAPPEEHLFTDILDLMERSFIGNLRDFQVESVQRTRNTFLGYEMYNAALNLNYQAMLVLLRAGADPNIQFNSEYIWQTLVRSVLTDIKVKPEKCSATLEMIDLLFQYSLKPAAQTIEKETMAEHLVRWELIVKNEREKKLCRDIIERLAAAKTTSPAVPIHASIAALPVAVTVTAMNELLEKRKRTSPYVQNVQILTTASALITTYKGEKLLIEGKKFQDLNEKELDQMCEMFVDSNFRLLGKDDGLKEKLKKYWKEVILANNGHMHFYMVKNHDSIMGFTITEVIDTEINGKPSQIYYSKLTLGVLVAYPGLMQLLFGICNFDGCDGTKLRWLTGEVLSASGFAIAHAMMEYPTQSQSDKLMFSLLSKIHPAEDIVHENGVWYVKDHLHATRTEDVKYTHFSVFYRSVYRKAYQKPGYALVIGYENNDESRRKFIENLSPLFGKENIIKMLGMCVSKQPSSQLLASVPKAKL